jgi:ankyrin repeat protein
MNIIDSSLPLTAGPSLIERWRAWRRMRATAKLNEQRAVLRGAGHVRRLINRGADPSVKNEDGSTPLERAVRWDKPDVLKALIDGGADPNERLKDGSTPLRLAIEWDKPEVLKALIEGGADPNERLKNGSTPLCLAIELNRLGISEALLAGGADMTATDDQLQTPLHSAARHRRDSLMGCLLKHGANPTPSDEVGKTPLHLCVRYRGYDTADVIVSIIQLLADHGADVNARDHKGRTALDVIDDDMKYVDRPSVRAKLERIRECLLSFDKEKAERLAVSLDAELPTPFSTARTGSRL